MLKIVNVGDVVTRWLAGVIPMQLVVSAVTEQRIICGAWEFDRETGAEIDEVLGWGRLDGTFHTGSFIRQ